MGISASEAGLDEARTWARTTGIEGIHSGTALVNALYHPMDGRVAEEVEIAGMDALVRPREAEEDHRCLRPVVAVDAAEASEAGEAVMLIVLCPVLVKRPGIDTDFDCFFACLFVRTLDLSYLAVAFGSVTAMFSFFAHVLYHQGIAPGLRQVMLVYVTTPMELYPKSRICLIPPNYW